MKKITPRLSDKSATWLETNFKSIHAGAEYCLDSLPAVARVYTGYELKGTFTADELKLMIDAMNGTALTPQFAGQHLPGNVADGIALDGLDTKWEVDADQIKCKIKTLSVLDIFFLEIWIQGFWTQSENVDLYDYVKPLL